VHVVQYAIVVDGTGKVTEHMLGHHTAGTVLSASIKVLNSTVVDGKRTVVMTRPLAGLTKQHHSFSPTALSIDFINALGSTPTFGYHKSKTVGTIALWPKTPSPTAAGGIAGYFRSNKAAGQQTRNDFTGEVGYEITPHLPLTVSALGRALPEGAVTFKVRPPCHSPLASLRAPSTTTSPSPSLYICVT